ncbi:MAG: glycosyltransferase [Candidatus Hydrothermia bacterium]
MRILFVSYFFPPFANATAVERTVMLIRHLRRRGNDIAVLTARNYTFMARDDSFLKYVPRDIWIVKPHALEPSTFLKAKDFSMAEGKSILRRFVWPDSRIFWLINAIPAGIRLVKQFKPDSIVSIAPPYTDLLLGYFLASRFKIPHFVDMLDPWSDDLYGMYPSAWQKKLTFAAEKLVMQSAKGFIVATYPMKWRLTEKYPFLKPEKVENITFGINEDLVKDVREIDYSTPFTLLYLGTMRGSHKKPLAFVEAFSDFVKEVKDARIIAVGNISEEAKHYFLSKVPEENLELHPYVKNERIAEFVNRAHVLWLLISRGTGFELVMPAKTITYLGFKRPILATVPEGWTASFLRQTGANVVDVDNSNEIFSALSQLYHAYQRKALSLPDKKVVNEFYYSKIAEKYESFLKSLM